VLLLDIVDVPRFGYSRVRQSALLDPVPDLIAVRSRVPDASRTSSTISECGFLISNLATVPVIEIGAPDSRGKSDGQGQVPPPSTRRRL
jgi:hypothetical protein